VLGKDPTRATDREELKPVQIKALAAPVLNTGGVPLSHSHSTSRLSLFSPGATLIIRGDF
jgi:hypothetical protein